MNDDGIFFKMFCSACGNSQTESANFCEQCGADCRKTDSEDLSGNTNRANCNKAASSVPLTFEQFIKKKNDTERFENVNESFCGMVKRKRDERFAAIGSSKKKKKDEIVKVLPLELHGPGFFIIKHTKANNTNAVPRMRQ